MQRGQFALREINSWIDTVLRHAEGAAADRLNFTTLRRAVLDINNNYICRHCLANLRYLIPEGKQLIVRFVTRGGTKVSVRFENLRDPEVFWNGRWQRLRGTSREIEDWFQSI